MLQLINCPKNDNNFRNDIEGTDEVEEWGRFMHTPEIFTDFDEIRKEIELQTIKIAGSNKGITNTPISLKIYSPKVVNLTLVDLPGLIKVKKIESLLWVLKCSFFFQKVAVGDQPDDIELQTLQLTMQYIMNPNSIILAVSSADADLATSESLKLAKKVDPEGKRTLAVLTKLDRVENFEDISDVLTGNFKLNIPIKLGIIGIVNRNTLEEKTIDEQLELERQFFEEKFPDIADKNGIQYLEQLLSNLLIQHIQSSLPALKEEISTKLEHYQIITRTCGESIEDKNEAIFKIAGHFSKEFNESIDGTSAKFNFLKENPVGGPAFRRVFDEKFGKEIRCVEPKINEEKIFNYLNKVGGARPLVFAPEILFHKIVIDEIEKLRKPSINCAESIRKEIDKVIQSIVESKKEKPLHYAKRFPILTRKINDVMVKLVNQRLPETLKLIDTIIDIEKASINTNHPDFSIREVMKAYLVTQPKDSKHETFLLNKNEQDALVIEKLIKEYFKLEKKKVEDSIPKCIMYNLVNFLKENIHTELLSKLSKNQESLLVESDEILKQRKEADLMVNALRKAELTIDEVYESAI